MEKKTLKPAFYRTCPVCGEKIKNPGINHCPKCNNTLWVNPRQLRKTVK